MKVVPIAIGIACLVVASIAHLETKFQEERKISYEKYNIDRTT